MVTARIPELKDCGCGVPLSLGSKIIAAAFLALSSIIFIFTLYYIGCIEFGLKNQESETQQRNETYLEVIAVMVMIVAGVHGTLAFLLWYGVVQHRPSYVLPWAVLTTAFTIILTFIALLMLLHKFHWIEIILWVIVVVLYYCNLIVYSHFRALRREKNLPQSLNENDAS
uniref:DUF7027 domain-containing protein n=1 Tax=Cuerna arida TaxID=1464854 RepID=A0A1B6FFK5_9HEMI